VPSAQYTFTHTNPASRDRKRRITLSIKEAGNLTSLVYRMAGKPFDQRDKSLFGVPFAQYIRLTAEATQQLRLGNTRTSLVGRFFAGIIRSFGNATTAPYADLFTVGGANSIRAFAVRDIGPGAFSDLGLKDRQDRQLFYLLRNGDLKFVANLELRTPIWGNLKGAVFLDMGNAWRLRPLDVGSVEDYQEEADALSMGIGETVTAQELYDANKGWTDQMLFKPSRLLSDIAIGTGVGLRYDLGFLVVRLDWGLAIHQPCDNGISRYFFNIERFSDMHTLHFAVGYPF
jgi:outer membrane protein assembly factor BamA